ncbi:hypothetical protein CTAYLR_008418 [Chrysophaeum taylorii]|uniref:Uncharacterized protein n=1 Tax=Chrysophaeum taylorii TaxID=2483200 RepID=A0AAD7XPT5_9STRA|nr:hypothetical protein CTAYLR_008418 [Chrysophaeum taylorii]
MRRVLAIIFMMGCSSSRALLLHGSTRTPRQHSVRLRKSPADEILDALDSMFGVGLSETDLKDEEAFRSDAFLRERQAQRDGVAPGDDALDKPSVTIFFALLGFFPIAFMSAAMTSGLVDPFHLQR